MSTQSPKCAATTCKHCVIFVVLSSEVAQIIGCSIVASCIDYCKSLLQWLQSTSCTRFWTPWPELSFSHIVRPAPQNCWNHTIGFVYVSRSSWEWQSSSSRPHLQPNWHISRLLQLYLRVCSFYSASLLAFTVPSTHNVLCGCPNCLESAASSHSLLWLHTDLQETFQNCFIWPCSLHLM